MSEFLLAHEAQVRLFFLFSILAIMAAWEVAAPRRRQEIPRLLRWSNNLGVVVIDTLLVRLTFPVLAVGMAVVGCRAGLGSAERICCARLAWLSLLAAAA